MASVVAVARATKQPYGGFVKKTQFEEIKRDDGLELSELENLPAGTVGTVVDYLTRFMMGNDVEEAFAPSCAGICIAERVAHRLNAIEVGKELLSTVKGLDDASIISACKLVQFDVYYRCLNWARQNQKDVLKEPNRETITNIRIMVERSLSFWEEYGPIVQSGFTFEPDKLEDANIAEQNCGGYTATVTVGDGDFLTEDTLWDFKVSKRGITKETRLQLLMYWIMGVHSRKAVFSSIKNLGVYNPRKNVVYLLNLEDVPTEVIKIIEDDVIGYGRMNSFEGGKNLPDSTSKQTIRYGILPSESKKGVRVSSIDAARAATSNVKRYEPGDVVDYKVFGRGRVVAVKPVAGGQIVEINFEKVGIKKMMANFAPLTKVEMEEK